MNIVLSLRVVLYRQGNCHNLRINNLLLDSSSSCRISRRRLVCLRSYLTDPFYAGPKLAPALNTPAKKFGLPLMLG